MSAIFGLYFNLPSELRMMVIDEMKPDDRCRFTRCSKLCNKEAKASRNYIYELEIRELSTQIIVVKAVFGQEDEKCYGFSVTFEEHQNGRKCMTRAKLYREKLCRCELESSTNIFEYSSAYFKDLLKTYQNTIKQLWIYGTGFKENFNFEIERLNNLEALAVEARSLPQFLQKTRHPLKVLEVYGKEGSEYLGRCEKVLQVQQRIFLPYANLNYTQFLQLSAKEVFIHIGQMTEENIAHFLKSWQTGERGEHLRRCTWILKSPFDVQRIAQFLGATQNEYGNYRINLLKDIGKSITLTHRGLLIICEWD